MPVSPESQQQMVTPTDPYCPDFRASGLITPPVFLHCFPYRFPLSLTRFQFE